MSHISEITSNCEEDMEEFEPTPYIKETDAFKFCIDYYNLNDQHDCDRDECQTSCYHCSNELPNGFVYYNPCDDNSTVHCENCYKLHIAGGISEND